MKLLNLVRKGKILWEIGIIIVSHLRRSNRIFRAYNELQLKYGDVLEANDDIIEINFNVLLKDFELGDSFTSDFVCTKRDGSLMVREFNPRKSTR